MKTPSRFINQNPDKMADLFEDKYYGEIPKYLKRIPEAGIYECNQEYIDLMYAHFYGSAPVQNMSPTLIADIEATINAIPNYGLVPDEENDALFRCIGLVPTDSCSHLQVKKIMPNGSVYCSVFLTSDCKPIVPQ